MSIQINNLTINRAGKTIVQIDELSLATSGAIALIGPNGSGKSTLLKAMAGIEPVPQGQVLLGQTPIGNISGHERARLIGFIPQSFTPCWNQRVDELMTLAASKTVDSKQAQTEAIHTFELGALQTQHWDVLSGGEKARVLCAMALMGEPPILFADEPGAALDIKHRLQIVQHFVTRAQQQLLIVCLHELDMVFRFFEKVILLNEGKIVYYGDTHDLLHQDLLDQTFGVRFERIPTRKGYVLYPKQTLNRLLNF